MSNENIVFNPDEWTFGDLETFEELTGLTLEEAFRPAPIKNGSGETEKDNRGRPVKAIRLSAKVMVAVAYITKRQADPDFSLDDARAMRFGEFSLGGGEDASPEDSDAASKD